MSSMVKAEAYVRSIIEPLCVRPEQLQVAVTEGDGLAVTIHASTKDLPLLIGRGGLTAQAIRQLVTIWGTRNNVFIRFSIP